MRHFLIKVSVIILAVIALHLSVAYLAGGHTDAYYLRYTTPRQQSLILGTSRAAQGLVPEVLNKELANSDYALPIYNFAFTNQHSPYGPAYLRAVKAKLDTNISNGIFILSVDPWSLSEAIDSEGDLAKFREAKLPLNTLECFTCKPNFEYLQKHYPKAWGNVLLQPWLTPELFLHHDGWLEVQVPMDEKSVAKRTSEKVEQYQILAKKYRISGQRLRALENLIDYLQQHGVVFLVRLPVGHQLLGIETEYWPGFSLGLTKLAANQGVTFFDLTANSSGYQFTDGNHLFSESGRVVSKRLGELIMLELERPSN